MRKTKAMLEYELTTAYNRISKLERELDISRLEIRVLRESPALMTQGAVNCTLQRLAEAVSTVTQGSVKMMENLDRSRR